MNDAQLAGLINNVRNSVDGLRADFGQLNSRLVIPGRSSPETPFSTYAVNLTTAHTDPGLRITMPSPVKFLQFYSDGTLDGISVRFGTQSDPQLNLNQMRVIPINKNYQDLWVTNDVRQGRSILVVYFVYQNTPLQIDKGGQDISLSETASRLGSIDTFDRRGQVLWMDDFEGGISKWTLSGDAGYTIAASTDYAESGLVSCKMVTNAVLNNYAQIARMMPIPSLSKIGCEFSFIANNNLKGTFDIILKFLTFISSCFHYWDLRRFLQRQSRWSLLLSFAVRTGLLQVR